MPDPTSTRERVTDIEETKEIRINADADGLYQFSVPAGKAGYLHSCQLANGAVACDASNGYEVSVLNRSDSDNVLGSFGFGSGTEAAKADDKDVAVAAYETATILNASNRAATDRVKAGDLVEFAIDRDGTTVRGTVTIFMDYDGIGR